MLEVKASLAATIVALTIFGAPLAASAAPIQTPITGISIHTEDDEFENEDEEDHEDEGENEDDETHEELPPVFVIPGNKKPHGHHPTTVTPDPDVTIDGSSLDPAGLGEIQDDQFLVVGTNDPTDRSLSEINPRSAKPVAIEKVEANRKTPADRFLDTAYFGMAALGISALGLGVTAAVRSIRLRKGGNADYFYDDK